MRRAIKIIILVLSYFSIVSAQSDVTVTDTIRSVTLEKFNVPQNKTIVLTNILDVNFNAELLDSDMQKLRDCSGQWQEPAPSEFPVTGKRGKMVQYLVHEMIEEAGTYYVRVNVGYRDEERRNSVTVYYMVEVDYPTMASEIDIRDSYS